MIYVKYSASYSGLGWVEPDCGPKTMPCITVSDGANHIIPGENSHIFLLDNQNIFKTQTTLTDLTLSAEYQLDQIDSSPTSCPITVSETSAFTGGFVQVSGNVRIWSINFLLKSALPGTLFATQPLSTLTFTSCSFANSAYIAAGIPYTVISLTRSVLILDNLVLNSVTFTGANPFIQASDVSDTAGDTATVTLNKCTFTDLTATSGTSPFISSTNGATLSCTGTQIVYSAATTLYTLFSLSGTSVIENCIIGKKEGATITGDIQLGADLISLLNTSLEIKTTVSKDVPTSTSISDLTLKNFALVGLVSGGTVFGDVTLTGVTFQNVDHIDSQKAVFATPYTLTGCTFSSIAQNTDTNVKALLHSDGSASTISGSHFYFTGTNMQNLMTVYGGSEIRSCTFAAAENGESIAISNTLISIATGNTNAVVIESCEFKKISSTPAAGVVKCEEMLRLILSSITLTFTNEARLYAFAVTSGKTMDFQECSIGPVSSGLHATLEGALITVGSEGSLVLSHTNITDLLITGENSCILTTPLTPAEGTVTPASSITIDTCSFKNVVHSTAQDKKPKIPIFNTPELQNFTISSCQFDCVEQHLADETGTYLLSAPKALSFVITDTKFYLPETVTRPILYVTQSVTSTGCDFRSSPSTDANDGTTTITQLEQPLIEVSAERTDLTLSSCTFSNLRAVNGVPAIVKLTDSVTLTVSNCSFTTVSSEIKIGQIFDAHSTTILDDCVFNEIVVPSDETANVCYWNASIVQLGGGDCTISNTLFKNISAGALSVTGGAHVKIDGWKFEQNNPTIEGYTTMERNINCTQRSTVTIQDSTIDKDSSLFIISNNCQLDFELSEGKQQPTSTFFIPILTSASGSVADDNKAITLVFNGDNLIPCSLFFKITLTDGSIFRGPVTDETAASTRSNAQSNSNTITTLTVGVGLENTPEVYDKSADTVCLVYADDKETPPVKLDLPFPTQRQAQGGSSTEAEPEDDKMAWWIWVLIGVGAFLLLLMVIIICCCCCNDEEEKEEEDEEEDMEAVKTMNTEALMALNTKDLLPSTAFKDFDANKVVTVEAMNTTEPFDKAVISAKKSIYYQIHSPTHRQDHNPFMWTATITYHVCQGIQHILDTVYDEHTRGQNELSASVMKRILNTLCPHNIFIGEHDSILLGSVPDSYQVPVSVNAKEGKMDFQLECQRYRSPEMTSHPNDDSRTMKESNAVYVIGFIMYEIFTGWLVFDGYDYSRVAEMVASGARPDLVLVRSVDSNFASIIDAATAMEPEDRPTIAQLLERIDMYLPNDLRKGGATHIMRRSIMEDDDL